MELKKKKGIGKRLLSLFVAVIMGVSLLGGMGAAEVKAAEKTDAELLDEAYWTVFYYIVDDVPDPVPNWTDEETLLNACRSLVSDKVTLSFTMFQKNNATTERQGSILATLLVSVGNESKDFRFVKDIQVLTQEDQKFEEAITKVNTLKDQVAMEASNEMTPEGILSALRQYIGGVEFTLNTSDKIEATLTEEGSFDISFQMTAGTNHSQNFTWHFTIPKRQLTDAEILEKAVAGATKTLNALEVTNDVYVPGLLQLIKSAIDPAVDANWVEDLKVVKATTTKEGSITGRLKLSTGSESAILPVNLTIPIVKEPQDDQKTDQEYIEEAKKAAYGALNAFVPSNDTTKNDIYNVIKNAVGKDINIEWYHDFKMIKAQKNQDGLIEEGALRLTKGDGLGFVSINLTIPALKDEAGNKPNQNDDKGKTDNTTKPQTTEKPKTTAKAVSPKTGDSSIMMFYIVALLAACGIAVVSVKRWRR